MEAGTGRSVTSQVRQFRDGLASVIEAVIPRANVYSYVPGSIAPPAVVIGPVTVDYDPSFERATDELSATVWAVVAHTMDIDAQSMVDEFLSGVGEWSIVEAVNSDSTLGGAVEDCRITEGAPIDLQADGGIVYVAAQFTVQAMSRR